MTQSLVPAGMLTGVQAHSAKLDDIAGMTLVQGDTIYWNGTHFVNLGHGTTGQMLTTGGASANPSWTTPSAGALVFLSSASPSAASSVNITANIDSTYDVYEVIANLTVSTNAVDLWLRVSEDGGATWKSGASDYSVSGGNAAQIKLTPLGDPISNSAGCGAFVRFSLAKPAATGIHKHTAGIGAVDCSGGGAYSGLLTSAGAYIGTTNAINAIQILASSGTISGTVALYGVRKS